MIKDWTTSDTGSVRCGGELYDVPSTPDEIDGRVLRRTAPGEYETIGTVDPSIGRIAII